MNFSIRLETNLSSSNKDLRTLGRWYPKNLESSNQSVLLLTSYELRNILPKDFAKIGKNRFATELLASISVQASISFDDYLALFEKKKSRWGAYSLLLFQSEDGTLYSKVNNNLTIASDEGNQLANFLSSRGACYGEKIERADYQWILDEQSQICVGRK